MRKICQKGYYYLHLFSIENVYAKTIPNITDTNNENDLYCIGNVEKGIEHEKIIKLIDEYLSVIEEDCCRCWATRMCGVCFAPIVPDEHQKITDIEKKQQCQRARERMHDALIKFYSVMEKDPKAFDFMDKMITE